MHRTLEYKLPVFPIPSFALLAVLIVALTLVEGLEGSQQAQPAAEERDLAAY